MPQLAFANQAAQAQNALGLKMPSQIAFSLSPVVLVSNLDEDVRCFLFYFFLCYRRVGDFVGLVGKF